MSSACPVRALPTDRYFEVSLYLLIATGFITLAGTGKLDALSLLYIAAVLIGHGVLLARNETVRIPERWTNAITLFYVAFYLADFFLISGSFVYATVHLVLFITGVKMFSIHRNRDYVYLTLFPFLMILAAAILTVDSTFFFAFILFLALATTTFISMEMKRSTAAAQSLAKQGAAAGRLAQSISVMAGLLVFGIVALGILLFFILPRTSAGYLNALAQNNQFVTGFGNDVELGQIGEIKQSSSVVMHIQIAGDSSGGFSNLKWRGVALGLFDGRRWSNPPSTRTPIHRSADGYFHALQPQASDAISGNHAAHSTSRNYGRSYIRYRVLMEPIGTNVFFLAPTGIGIAGRYRLLSADDAGSLMTYEEPISAYDAYSDLAQPSAMDLRNAQGEINPDIKLDYLQLPHLDPRVPALAQQVTASSANAYDKASAIESYLSAHYAYTLKLSKTLPRDPIAEFLFERKQGHCEYFASAMALMLRTLGIPSRVVNGFRGAQFNDVTGSYIIRASEAHTWVEAYFPGYGWTTFDPTPPDPNPTEVHNSRFLLYVDAMGEFWREWVINYDFSHQFNLRNQMFAGSQQMANRWRRSWLRNSQALVRQAHESKLQNISGRNIAIILIFATLLALAANVRALLRARRSRQIAAHPEQSPRAAASIWYERMTRALARRGWTKKSTQTPAEFVNSIADPQLRQVVAQFTDHYESARFGEGADDALCLPRIYEQISAI